MKKRTLIITLCLLLGVTFLSIPVYASNDVTINVCDPWEYQYSYYECRDGDTWIVDVYKRNCDGRVEIWRDANPYIEGVCPYIAINPNE